MSSEEPRMSQVNELASAPTLDVVPEIVDLRSRVPLNPPQAVQEKFVGSSYFDAYSEAARFVDRAFQHWPNGAVEDQAILDFGAGWGRITRMLLRRFEAPQIWTSDVDAQMTVLIHSTLAGVNAMTNAAMPPMAFREGMFDAVTAFSVFSHLSEDAHKRWAKEFGRVTRVEGMVYITLLEENFLGQVAGAQSAVEAGTADNFTTKLAKVLPEPTNALEQFRRGKFIYGGGGEDGPRSKDFYGWAVAPRPWLERTWGDAGFAIESWIPTGELFEQAMVVLVRRSDGGFGRRLLAKIMRIATRIRNH